MVHVGDYSRRIETGAELRKPLSATEHTRACGSLLRSPVFPRSAVGADESSVRLRLPDPCPCRRAACAFSPRRLPGICRRGCDGRSSAPQKGRSDRHSRRLPRRQRWKLRRHRRRQAQSWDLCRRVRAPRAAVVVPRLCNAPSSRDRAGEDHLIYGRLQQSGSCRSFADDDLKYIFRNAGSM